MIGNDIVDLKLASRQSDWQRKGWLQKLFTNAEQRLILASENPQLQVWKFWSMKEATYKAHQRQFSLSPKYNPRDFSCHSDTVVRVDQYEYTTTTKYVEHYVYSTSMFNSGSYISEVYDKEQHARLELKKNLSLRYGVKLAQIELIKDENQIPVVLCNKIILKDLNFSLTHHGNFSAFVIDL